MYSETQFVPAPRPTPRGFHDRPWRPAADPHWRDSSSYPEGDGARSGGRDSGGRRLRDRNLPPNGNTRLNPGNSIKASDVDNFIYCVKRHRVTIWLDPPARKRDPQAPSPIIETAPLLLRDFLGGLVGVVTASPLTAAVQAFDLAKRLREETGDSVGYVTPTEHQLSPTQTVVCLPATLLLARVLGHGSVGEKRDTNLSEFTALIFPRVAWDHGDTQTLLTLLNRVTLFHDKLKVIIHSHLPSALAYVAGFEHPFDLAALPAGLEVLGEFTTMPDRTVTRESSRGENEDDVWRYRSPPSPPEPGKNTRVEARQEEADSQIDPAFGRRVTSVRLGPGGLPAEPPRMSGLKGVGDPRLSAELTPEERRREGRWKYDPRKQGTTAAEWREETGRVEVEESVKSIRAPRPIDALLRWKLSSSPSASEAESASSETRGRSHRDRHGRPRKRGRHPSPESLRRRRHQSSREKPLRDDPRRAESSDEKGRGFKGKHQRRHREHEVRRVPCKLRHRSTESQHSGDVDSTDSDEGRRESRKREKSHRSHKHGDNAGRKSSSRRWHSGATSSSNHGIDDSGPPTKVYEPLQTRRDSSLDSFLLPADTVVVRELARDVMHVPQHKAVVMEEDLSSESRERRVRELLAPFIVPPGLPLDPRHPQDSVGIYVSAEADRGFSAGRPDLEGVYFLETPTSNFVAETVDTILRLHEAVSTAKPGLGAGRFDDAARELGTWGSFLVILPSEAEIEVIMAQLAQLAEGLRTLELRSMDLVAITSKLSNGDQLRFLTVGSTHRPASDAQRVFLTTADYFDTHCRWPLPFSISAIIDCGLAESPSDHPFAPMALRYRFKTPVSQSTLVERIHNSRLAAYASGRMVTQPAYYLAMTEETFLQQLPASSAHPFSRDADLTLRLALLNQVLQLECRSLFGGLQLSPLPPVPFIEKTLEFLRVADCLDDAGAPRLPMARRVLDWHVFLTTKGGGLVDASLATLMAISDDDAFTCTLEAAALVAMLCKAPQPFFESKRKGQLTPSVQDVKWLKLARMSFAVEEGDAVALVGLLQQASDHRDDAQWFTRHMLVRRDLIEAMAFMDEIVARYRVIHKRPVDEVPFCGASTQRLVKAIAASHFAKVVVHDPRKAIDPFRQCYRLWQDVAYRQLTDREGRWTSTDKLSLLVDPRFTFSDADRGIPGNFLVFHGRAEWGDRIPGRLLAGVKELGDIVANGIFLMKWVTPVKPEWLAEFAAALVKRAEAF